MSEAHRERMRERLIDAARECLVLHGYEGTGARDILERAGVSAGTLYNYFDSKDDLLAAIADQFGQSVTSDVAAEDDLDDALARVVYANFVHQRPPSLQPALRVRAAFDNRLRTALSRYDETVESVLLPLLEEAQARGSIRADLDLQALVEFIAVCFEGLESRITANGIRTSRDRIARLLLDLLALGVATPRSRLRRRLLAGVDNGSAGRKTK